MQERREEEWEMKRRRKNFLPSTYVYTCVRVDGRNFSGLVTRALARAHERRGQEGERPEKRRASVMMARRR